MTSARMSDNLKEINAFQRSFGSNRCILDVVFLLDGSRQVETNGVGNFQREINFVKKAANYLPLSRNDVHIGVGLLGNKEIHLQDVNVKDDVKSGVQGEGKARERDCVDDILTLFSRRL